MSIIQAAQNYVTTSAAFKSAGGEVFLKERLDLKNDFCHLESVLTTDQINSIKNNFPVGPVQEEVKARLDEWSKKLNDSLIKKVSDSPVSVEGFAKKVTVFYTRYTGLLNSQVYSEFNEAKISTRTVFLNEYKTSSVEAVEDTLTKAEIDADFIRHASNEWGRWKAKF